MAEQSNNEAHLICIFEYLNTPLRCSHPSSFQLFLYYYYYYYYWKICFNKEKYAEHVNGYRDKEESHPLIIRRYLSSSLADVDRYRCDGVNGAWMLVLDVMCSRDGCAGPECVSGCRNAPSRSLGGGGLIATRLAGACSPGSGTTATPIVWCCLLSRQFSDLKSIHLIL